MLPHSHTRNVCSLRDGQRLASACISVNHMWMYVCARDAFRIIGWDTLARAYRFVSLSRPLYARAYLPLRLSLSAAIRSRAPSALATAGLHSRMPAISVSRSLRCSHGKPARGHVDQTQPRMLPPFAIVPVLICRQAPIAWHVPIPRSASNSRYRSIDPKTLVWTRSADTNNIPWFEIPRTLGSLLISILTSELLLLYILKLLSITFDFRSLLSFITLFYIQTPLVEQNSDSGGL